MAATHGNGNADQDKLLERRENRAFLMCSYTQTCSSKKVVVQLYTASLCNKTNDICTHHMYSQCIPMPQNVFVAAGASLQSPLGELVVLP